MLAVGVKSAEGRFEEGEAVEVIGPDGGLVAKGLTRWSSERLAAEAGTRNSDEVIHRDDLVVLLHSPK